MRLIILFAMPLLLGGCLARAVVDVVTLPVKAASRTVDVLTTSQAEADQKRGRAIRQREECIGEEQRRSALERRAPNYGHCRG